MLKFLRWLLVPLLPLVGLVGGAWLIPDSKPHWKTKFDHEITPLGFVEQDRLFLVAESGNNIIKSLKALNVLSGEVEHHVDMPVELLTDKRLEYRQVKLHDDSHQVFLIPDRRNSAEEQLVVFDWMRQRVVHRYQASSYEHGALNSPILKGTTLVAHGGRGNSLNLVIWDASGKDPVGAILCASKYSSFDIGLSETGLLANLMIKEQNDDRLLLIDTKKHAIIQTILGTFQEVHWAPDDRSFLAIELDVEQNHLVGKKYVLGENGFAHDLKDTTTFGFNSDPPFVGRPFITFSHRNITDPWRMKISTALGPHFQFLLDRLWPVGQIIQLHDKQDSRLRHRFVNTDQDSWILWPFPNQKGTALAFSSGNSVEYWDIYPTSRWYPAIGLVVGVIFSVLLVWKPLRPSWKTAKPLVTGTLNRAT